MAFKKRKGQITPNYKKYKDGIEIKPSRYYHANGNLMVGSIDGEIIKDSLVTVLSLALLPFQVVLSYLISCYPTVRAIGGCLYQRSSKNVFLDPKCLICQRSSWSCGTLLVIGLVFIALIGWMV